MIDDLLKSFQSADPLLSAKKVAALLGITEHTLCVWRWKKKKGEPAPDLPFVKVGRRTIRYRRSAVQGFIEAGGVRNHP